MTSAKTTVLHTQAMHSSSLNRRIESEDFQLSLRIVKGRGLDYGTKVMDSGGTVTKLDALAVCESCT